MQVFCDVWILDFSSKYNGRVREDQESFLNIYSFLKQRLPGIPKGFPRILPTSANVCQENPSENGCRQTSAKCPRTAHSDNSSTFAHCRTWRGESQPQERKTPLTQDLAGTDTHGQGPASLALSLARYALARTGTDASDGQGGRAGGTWD